MERQRKSYFFLLTINYILLVTIFIVDLLTPLGIANGVMYVFCILITLWLPKRQTLTFCIFSTLLTILAIFFLEPVASMVVFFTNRVLSLLVIWGTTYAVYRRHMMEQLLQKSKLFNQWLIDNALGVILQVDQEGKIVYANAQAEDLFGYRPNELMNQPIENLIPTKFKKQHIQYRDDYFKNPECRPMGSGKELYGLHKTGREIPVEISLKPINIQKDRPVLAHIIDITDRKKAIDKIKEYAMQLKRSNKELDDFAYIASHDLKEPLRGIGNFSKFLIEDHAKVLGEEGLEKLNIIIGSTKQLEVLINGLLYYSRLGRQNLSPSVINLKEIVDAELIGLQPSLKDKSMNVIVNDPLPRIVADKLKISELIRNLIINAIKYNDKEEGKIAVGFLEKRECRTEREIKNDHIIFYVQDNGLGIDIKHQDKVFMVFRRLHKRDAYGGGIGLGLTICKKIVEQHGGDIWLESKKGIGTTFYFTLPGDK